MTGAVAHIFVGKVLAFSVHDPTIEGRLTRGAAGRVRVEGLDRKLPRPHVCLDRVAIEDLDRLLAQRGHGRDCFRVDVWDLSAQGLRR